MKKARAKDVKFMEPTNTAGKRYNPDMPASGRNPSKQVSVGFMEPTQKGDKRSNPK
jgi:hypothetical protein